MLADEMSRCMSSGERTSARNLSMSFSLISTPREMSRIIGSDVVKFYRLRQTISSKSCKVPNERESVRRFERGESLMAGFSISVVPRESLRRKKRHRLHFSACSRGNNRNTIRLIGNPFSEYRHAQSGGFILRHLRDRQVRLFPAVLLIPGASAVGCACRGFFLSEECLLLKA